MRTIVEHSAVGTTPGDRRGSSRAPSSEPWSLPTAADNRGRDIVILDLRELTTIFDYFVIATGTSRRQLHAMSEEIDHALEQGMGDRRQGIEGYEQSSWILLDYGDGDPPLRGGKPVPTTPWKICGARRSGSPSIREPRTSRRRPELINAPRLRRLPPTHFGEHPAGTQSPFPPRAGESD